jgi:hypothetical protein
MRKDIKDYYYNSAKVLLKNGEFFGEPINIEDDKELVVLLYVMWLEHDQLKKEMEREYFV